MPAFFQHCDGVIRYGPEARQYGDPYLGSVGVVRRSDEECELVAYAPVGGHMPEAPMPYFHEVLDVLRQQGYRQMAISRRRPDGTIVEKVFDLAKHQGITHSGVH